MSDTFQKAQTIDKLTCESYNNKSDLNINDGIPLILSYERNPIMNKASKITLLIVSALLIIGGIGAAVFAIATESDKNKNKDKETDSAETTVLHDDVEYVYDDDGNIKSERYYENNVFMGQRDYFRTETAEYITVFDKDGNEVGGSVTEFNIVGSVSKTTTYKFHLLSETVEYDYYDDLRTPEKKTVKTYVGNDIYAEKTYYGENGKKTRQCTFLNDTTIEDNYFDEKGNIIKNGGETSEE